MKNRIIKTALIALIAGVSIFGISYFIQSQVKAASNSTNTSTPGTLAQGEINPNGYNYHINTGQFEALSHTGAPYYIATYGNFQIYCINPGAPIKFSYDIRYEDAKAMVGQKHNARCGCAATPRQGDVTPPVFTPVGTYTLPVAAAYIVSDEPIGSWSIDKQRAIWNLKDETIHDSNGDSYDEPADGDIIIGDGHSQNSGPSIYDEEAINYASYDKSVRENGLQPQDKTDLDGVYTKVNQTKKEYTVGPFNIQYTNGIFGNLAFSGISNMTVIGYNSKKEQVRDNIKIEKFVLKDDITGVYDSAKTPNYFTPSKDLKVDEAEGTENEANFQVYPQPGQDFEIVFKDPNAGLSSDDDNRVAYISIKVKFKYMLANGEYTKLRGTKYTVSYRHAHDAHTHICHHYDSEGGHSGCHTVSCYNCETTCYLSSKQQQWLMAADAVRSIYEQEIMIGTDGDIIILDTTMDLGGHVWEDGVGTKESKADGVSNTSGRIDKALPNVKVTLYVYENGREEIATLLSDPDESGISTEELMHRVNPTYTDEDGNYLFKGLDSMKKYIVKFEYNGQIYLPTEYLNTSNKQYSSVSQMVNAGLYNTTKWEVSSKGTEDPDERDDYDNTFAEIGSYPRNYRTSNSLGQARSGYNATFTQRDLMGYTLDRNGNYKQTEVQLIDGYLYDSKGLETTRYSEGVITTKVRDYIKRNREFPSESAMKRIYRDIAGNDEELWQKLQFIEDCQIEAYTGSPLRDGRVDTYPVYDQFKINSERNGNYDMTVDVIDGVTYRPIYEGQFYVNLGLWRRQEYDSALRKDVYRATLKINDKTVIYKYDKRTDDEEYWDINVRMEDYDAYYNTGYNREIYRTDYEYNSVALGHPGAELKIYVTYKITVRNQSQSIMSQIREVVDFYDEDYTYRDDLSWVTYIDGNKNNKVTDDEYYEAMVAENTSKIKNARETKSTESSRYGSATHSNMTNDYQAVYIRGLQNKKLATGESAYIYLTFEVNKDKNGRVILDNESSPKNNFAEINGYTTFYKDNTELPNGITKDSNDVAGLLDRDSNPGNLVLKDIRDNDRYEKNFEDDTDRAKSLRVLIDENAVRRANGTVWEDERTNKVDNSIIGDGIRKNNETKVAGVTVQLVEKMIDGKEYIWQETTTDANGYYSFEKYIPGDYTIRFYYGNTTDTVKTNTNGGKNPVSYNGQDFKSTLYQTGMTQSEYTDTSNKNQGYLNTEKQNETGTYGYDIYAADAYGTNVSDAKDLWTVSTIPQRKYHPSNTVSEKKAIQSRSTVNSYSFTNVTNHKAEVLASPYETPSYNGTAYTNNQMNDLINELITNTYMTAETGVIAVEFEYDRQQTDGLTNSNGSKQYLYGNDVNGKYTLNNIDLGITERPKAQLEIDKSVTNVKVTLANNSILFDINGSDTNAIWKDHTEYNLASKKSNGKYDEYYGNKNKHRYSYRETINNIVSKADNGLIQLTMDEELMHGATIQITYQLKVTNVGEVDYEGQNFYYLGNATGNIVTTTANQVVDYVANNLQFNSNNTDNKGWSVIGAESLKTQGLVNGNLSDNLAKFNNIIQTEGLNKVLKPGEEAQKTLVLTQLITTENTNDDLTYSNMTEIIKTSNAVGRRMAYSVVGNQNPTDKKAAEVDSSMAEKVVILPPFGETHIYYIIGAVVAVILIGGIILIKKKVLDK